MIIKVTNTQNGKSAQFVSSWTLPYLKCDSFNKMTASDNLSLKFEMDKLPRGFDSQVNPTSTIVNIFNSNEQILSSNAYYDRMLTVHFRNLNTITSTKSVAEELASLFTLNDKTMFLQVFDDRGIEYTSWCAIKEVPKNVFYDSFTLQMMSNTFSKVTRSKEYQYSQFVDEKGNVVDKSKYAWKFPLEIGVNSYFLYNFNNILDTKNSLRLSFNNNRSSRLDYIIFRDVDVLGNKAILDLRDCNIYGSENVVIDLKDKVCIVNLTNDFSSQITFPQLGIYKKYRLEFVYRDNPNPNPIYTFETLEDVLTIPHVMFPFDDGGK